MSWVAEGPHLLLSRGLKAWYFTNSFFSVALLGDRPPSTWRGISQSRAVLEQGIRIQIGNGQDTWIWRDTWLRSDGSGWIITRRSISSTFPERVADITDHHFWSIDRYRIMQVPIGTIATRDHLIWSPSRTGKFVVRSCYHMVLASKLTFSFYQQM